MKRPWPDGPYWIASLATGITRLGMAGVVIVLPDVAQRPLFLPSPPNSGPEETS